MKNVPGKYELCNRFNEKELAEMSLHLATKKDLHYIRNVKKLQAQKEICGQITQAN